MKVPLVDLKAQYESIRREVDAAIAAVIAESAFIGSSQNRFVRDFESAFARYLGVPSCVGCANGTDALEILLHALGVGRGDEVIVPAHSWISTAEAVSSVGAVPCFVDSRPDVYTIDPERIEERITRRTRAIIPVHLYGLPADMDPILELARCHRLHVVEDCAQAHGATYKGRMVGTLGDAAAFSFYPGKNLGAYGDAGAMVMSDPLLERRARMIANHGQLKKHEHQLEGRNSRLDGIQAAVLGVKLPHLDNWTRSRQRHAAGYAKALAGLPLRLPCVPDGSTHVYHLYVISAQDRDAVRLGLTGAGVATGIPYPNALPTLPPYAARGCLARDYPVSVEDCRRVLSIPMYPELKGGAIELVASTVRQVLALA